MDPLTAVPEKDRLHTLDILRGFSLLGILLVNMKSFYAPALYETSLVSGSGSDRIVEQLISFFAQASFYPLFSFLFGAGTVIFYERALKKGHSFNVYYSRRLIGLLIIGLLHAFLIWHGDILANYALIGFLFLLFIKWNSRGLIKWGLFILLLPNVLITFALVAAYAADPEMLSHYKSEEAGQQSADAYQTGSFFDITQQRVTDWLYVNNFENAFFLVISILPLFMLGAAAYKRGWFHKDLSSEWKRTALITGTAAVLLKGAPLYWEENLLTQHLQLSLGGPALTLFYVSVILLLLNNYSFKLGALKAAGRASLSNYLMQSLVCTFLFYSYGFGLYGNISAAEGVMIAAILYSVQLIVSYYWFRTFRFGPAEWLLRKWIYLFSRA
ncbi:DUF418 domain-containing protein [Metabacillus indicus]|uniref:DUF418 domain-containing protein n=1 Tax=Metabacillus indicus TaxID=246786 RepID=UPI002A014C7A|nr:DUF418 domain-containing protein [Metabacillus indicus]MDX8289522.1 DUF418 domain-containing protein [Metabacillus indicus]